MSDKPKKPNDMKPAGAARFHKDIGEAKPRHRHGHAFHRYAHSHLTNAANEIGALGPTVEAYVSNEAQRAATLYDRAMIASPDNEAYANSVGRQVIESAKANLANLTSGQQAPSVEQAPATEKSLTQHMRVKAITPEEEAARKDSEDVARQAQADEEAGMENVDHHPDGAERAEAAEGQDPEAQGDPDEGEEQLDEEGNPVGQEGMVPGQEQNGPVQPYGYQILERSFEDAAILMQDNEAMLQLCEEPSVRRLLTKHQQYLATMMDDIETITNNVYGANGFSTLMGDMSLPAEENPDGLPGENTDADTMDDNAIPSSGGERRDNAPSPEEALDGMAMADTRRQLKEKGKKSLPDNRKKAVDQNAAKRAAYFGFREYTEPPLQHAGTLNDIARQVHSGPANRRIAAGDVADTQQEVRNILNPAATRQINNVDAKSVKDDAVKVSKYRRHKPGDPHGKKDVYVRSHGRGERHDKNLQDPPNDAQKGQMRYIEGVYQEMARRAPMKDLYGNEDELDENDLLDDEIEDENPESDFPPDDDEEDEASFKARSDDGLDEDTPLDEEEVIEDSAPITKKGGTSDKPLDEDEEVCPECGELPCICDDDDPDATPLEGEEDKSHHFHKAVEQASLENWETKDPYEKALLLLKTLKPAQRLKLIKSLDSCDEKALSKLARRMATSASIGAVLGVGIGVPMARHERQRHQQFQKENEVDPRYLDDEIIQIGKDDGTSHGDGIVRSLAPGKLRVEIPKGEETYRAYSGPRSLRDPVNPHDYTFQGDKGDEVVDEVPNTRRAIGAKPKAARKDTWSIPNPLPDRSEVNPGGKIIEEIDDAFIAARKPPIRGVQPVKSIQRGLSTNEGRDDLDLNDLVDPSVPGRHGHYEPSQIVGDDGWLEEEGEEHQHGGRELLGEIQQKASESNRRRAVRDGKMGYDESLDHNWMQDMPPEDYDDPYWQDQLDLINNQHNEDPEMKRLKTLLGEKGIAKGDVKTRLRIQQQRLNGLEPEKFPLSSDQDTEETRQEVQRRIRQGQAEGTNKLRLEDKQNLAKDFDSASEDAEKAARETKYHLAEITRAQNLLRKLQEQYKQ